MTTFRTSTESAREVAADLLIVPVTTGDGGGSGLEDTGLADVYKAARLTGKKGEDLLVTRRDGDRCRRQERAPRRRRGEGRPSTSNALRRSLAKAVAGVRRFPSVATTFAQALPARQAAEAVQAVVEAIDLGQLSVRALPDVEGRRGR